MRLPASASLPLASCWPRPQQLLPVSATGGGRRRCTSSVSGLTVTTMTVSPTKREPPFGAGTPGGGFLFLRMVNLTFGIPDLSIPDSPQKSSAVQKVYRAGLAAEGRPVFVQPLRRCAPAPLVGEPLAKPFTLRGLPKPLLQGATATTAASGGNRESLLGPRPAGCKRQRSRRWEPQPGLVCEAD